MAKSVDQRYEQLRVAALLDQHSGLRILPSRNDDLVFNGSLRFVVNGPENESIEDQYDVEMRAHPGFPSVLPSVRETAGRIPASYHKLPGGKLCLGAPTAVRLALTLSPTLPTFVNRFVIPYLYGYSFYLKNGRMPYGELAHGDDGIRQYLAEMFSADFATRPEEFLRLAGKKRRDANKRPCPCGSDRRLGRCHNRSVNGLRKQIGRHWFREEYARVTRMLMPARISASSKVA